MKVNQIALSAALACACTVSFAQSSSVTLYGSIDQYLNYIKSSNNSSTNTIKSLNDGAYLRSRVGFKGVEDLGNGLSAKFQLEQGLSADVGSAADTARLFDRQAWVGLASPEFGEFRAGRQNTAVFYRGDYIDFGSRTLGSVVNAFGTPSRYDNDLSWISPRWSGVQLEGHYSLGEVSSTGAKQGGVYQLAIDYLNGPYRVGYADITGKKSPLSTATITKDVTYRNIYANYDYGQGKVYAVFIRSNNSTSQNSSTGAVQLTNGAAILGNVGGVVPAADSSSTTASYNPTMSTDVKRYYNIIQLSADYRVTPQLRVGALYGQIKDTSDSNMGAKGGAIGAYYDLSKRTMLLALVDTISNQANGSFRPAGSAGLAQNFTGADAIGKRINGVHAGIVHKF